MLLGGGLCFQVPLGLMPDNYSYLFNASFSLLCGSAALQVPMEGDNPWKGRPKDKM